MGRDRAGSTLLKAKNLGTLTSELNISRDFVGKSDLSDLYCISVGNRSNQTIATSAAEYAQGIAVDSSGNVYITGETEGTLPGQTSAGGTDRFVAKYGSTGTQQWLEQSSTAGLDEL